MWQSNTISHFWGLATFCISLGQVFVLPDFTVAPIISTVAISDTKTSATLQLHYQFFLKIFLRFSFMKVWSIIFSVLYISFISVIILF